MGPEDPVHWSSLKKGVSSCFVWPFSFLWRERCPCCLNRLSHRSQRKSFLSVWINKCVSKWFSFLKIRWHRVQAYFLHICLFKWAFWLKHLSHWPHIKGFTFEWTKVCLFRPDTSRNCLLHWLHKNCTCTEPLSMWPFWCLLMWLDLRNDLSHMSQMKEARASVCVLLCTPRELVSWNDSPQRRQR